MRIESLLLERFGIFADAGLDFGDGRGLHVIYGPNEAGKSTALAAIGDLLFGIEERTPYEFRFGYGKLRIGAKIIQSNGTRLEFKRRKARTGSLISLSSPETPLPDAALEPFLGAVDREKFQFLFGLDQDRLRKGGRDMLNPQGNFGQTLFSAGTGLESVQATLTELDREIKELGSLNERRSKSAIWAASDRFIEAVKAKRTDILGADLYQGAEKQRDAAAAQRREIDDQVQRLRARRNFLERGLKVAPSLVALDRLREQLAETADAPDLPENFEAQWKEADDAARSAGEAAGHCATAAENLAQKLALAPPPQGIVEFAREIDSLNERLGKYLGDLDDVPKLASRILDHNAAIATSLRALGLAVDPADVESVLPSKIKIARVRELISQSAVVRSDLHKAGGGLADAKAAAAEAEAALEALPPVVDATEPADWLDRANKLGDVGKFLASAAAEAGAADLALAESLKRLGFGPEAAGDLASMPVPDAATVKFIGERWSAGLQKRATLDAALDEAERRSLEIDAALAGLAVAGEVPTAQAIGEARDAREDLWRKIREALFSGGAAAEAVGPFETAVRHADALVDRREAEAQRIAQLASLTAERQKAGDAVTRIKRQRQLAVDEWAALDVEWRGLWRADGVVVKTPAEMLQWLGGRDEALRLRGEAAKAAQTHRAAEANAHQRQAFLRRAAQIVGLAASDAAESPDELERLLRLALKSLQLAASERSKAEVRLATARQEAHKAWRAFEAATKADAEWRAGWASAVEAIGLPAGAGSAEAEAGLAAWEAMLVPLNERRSAQRRHKGLGEDLAQFRAEAAQLVGELAEPVAPGPVDKTIRSLKTRLDEAKAQAQARAGLAKNLAEAQELAEAAQEEVRRRLARLAALRQTHAIAPQADVYALARQSAQRRDLRKLIEDRGRELAGQGEGLDEAALRAEAGAMTLDEAKAELAAIKQGESPLIEKLQALAKDETDASHEIAALGARRGAAFADQEAKNAVAAAGGLVERWLRLEIARRLLERSVRRYQDENQDPMIQRASDIFAKIASTAANPIERVTIDYRNAAKPAPVGLRRDGSDCGLEGLSEATRDQLFLALRVAAIEKFCASHEPMPFIADDLFMTSDEQRVLPLLQILAELGRTTQVIAFTHHRHVLDIAKTVPSDEVRTHIMPAMAIAPG